VILDIKLHRYLEEISNEYDFFGHNRQKLVVFLRQFTLPKKAQRHAELSFFTESPMKFHFGFQM
jgi:hypothetical protein